MANSRQIEHTAAAWLARRDGAHWNADQQAQLETWLARDTAHRVAFLRLEAAWGESGRLAALGAGLAQDAPPARGTWTDPAASRELGLGMRERHPRRGVAHEGGPPDLAHLVFARRAEPAPSRWPSRLAWSTFAGVSLAVVFAWQWYRPMEQASYLTAMGDLRDVPLSDGSRATLSSDSAMAIRLSRAQRHVDLQRGEAFFEVAKDPGRPFAVEAGGRTVVAVGTRFAVRRDGPDLRVVVTEGVVRLEGRADAQGHAQPTTLLPAGSIALATRDGVVVRTGSVADAERMVDWRSGFLVFHDTSLAEAVAEFNRYNPRKLVIGDPAVGALRVGGNFRWSNTDVFVRLLEQGFPVRAEHRADRIVLHSQ